MPRTERREEMQQLICGRCHTSVVILLVGELESSATAAALVPATTAPELAVDIAVSKAQLHSELRVTSQPRYRLGARMRA